MKETVVWRIPEIYNGTNPQKVYDEIQTLEAVTAENILELAKDESLEIHKCFEWDDSIAAEKYRLSQAKNIVCNLVIKPAIKGETRTIRMLHKTEPGVYKPVQYIVKQKDEYEALLARAKEDAIRYKKRYEQLVELKDLIAEIDVLVS